jgi:hypothetical protein
MERRDFIKRTAAVASVTAIGGIAGFQVDAKTLLPPLRDATVLVDERFSDSRRFAAALEARGAIVVSLSEDIGRLWYGELGAQCRRPGSFIAGLTLHTELFVSQLFARECGKKLAAFGQHDCRGQSTLVHSLPSNLALNLSDANDWPETIAATLSGLRQCEVTHVSRASRVVRAVDHPGTLYSWMIA